LRYFTVICQITPKEPEIPAQYVEGRHHIYFFGLFHCFNLKAAATAAQYYYYENYPYNPFAAAAETHSVAATAAVISTESHILHLLLLLLYAACIGLCGILY
jgi:hypothetical protein